MKTKQNPFILTSFLCVRSVRRVEQKKMKETGKKSIRTEKMNDSLGYLGFHENENVDEQSRHGTSECHPERNRFSGASG